MYAVHDVVLLAYMQNAWKENPEFNSRQETRQETSKKHKTL